MTKKILNTAKATLLAATLFITSLAAVPQVAKAWEIDIYCLVPSSNICAIIIGSDFGLIVFGDLIGVEIFT